MFDGKLFNAVVMFKEAENVIVTIKGKNKMGLSWVKLSYLGPKHMDYSFPSSSDEDLSVFSKITHKN